MGIVRIEDALRLAHESDLDLVEVAPNAKPPVCKLMDFGKYKYEAAVKAREARKNQTNTVLKEVRFRLKIDKHDYETKVGHALRFLGAGDKVKAMIQFRGREQQRPEMGIRLLEKFAEDVAEVGAVESNPRIDGRNMVMVVGPLKNKAEARREQQQKSGGRGSKRRVATELRRKPRGRTWPPPWTTRLAPSWSRHGPRPRARRKPSPPGSPEPAAFRANRSFLRGRAALEKNNSGRLALRGPLRMIPDGSYTDPIGARKENGSYAEVQDS